MSVSNSMLRPGLGLALVLSIAAGCAPDTPVRPTSPFGPEATSATAGGGVPKTGPVIPPGMGVVNADSRQTSPGRTPVTSGSGVPGASPAASPEASPAATGPEASPAATGPIALMEVVANLPPGIDTPRDGLGVSFRGVRLAKEGTGAIVSLGTAAGFDLASITAVEVSYTFAGGGTVGPVRQELTPIVDLEPGATATVEGVAKPITVTLTPPPAPAPAAPSPSPSAGTGEGLQVTATLVFYGTSGTSGTSGGSTSRDRGLLALPLLLTLRSAKT